MSQRIAIILRIAADRATEFEEMFEAEEIPVWDEFVADGLFLEASLTRVEGGSENPTGEMGGGPEGIQDYILQVLVRDSAAHGRHDDDPRFKAFLNQARLLQPMKPLVFFGSPVFERPIQPRG